jgi:hypothetical protein
VDSKTLQGQQQVNAHVRRRNKTSVSGRNKRSQESGKKMRDDDTHATIIRAGGDAEGIGKGDGSNHVERNMSAMKELRRGLKM